MRKQYHVVLDPRAARRSHRDPARVARGGADARATPASCSKPMKRCAAAVRGDRQVAALCGVSPRTVARVRERFATDGFAVALHGRPHPGSAPKLSAAQEARLIALACTAPPAGRARWSVRLLAARAVELEAMPPLSRELVRTTLKKTGSNRGASNAG